MNLTVKEVPAMSRVGVKGPNAMQWLVSQGVMIPPTANSWVASGDTLVLRLGNSEFLIEGHAVCGTLETASQPVSAGVYKVTRADAVFLVSGVNALNLLAEVCQLDLRESAVVDDAVLMTQIAGVSATLIRQLQHGQPGYRIVCDGTYATFMRETLLKVAEDLGGDVVGFD